MKSSVSTLLSLSFPAKFAVVAVRFVGDAAEVGEVVVAGAAEETGEDEVVRRALDVVATAEAGDDDDEEEEVVVVVGVEEGGLGVEPTKVSLPADMSACSCASTQC